MARKTTKTRTTKNATKAERKRAPKAEITESTPANPQAANSVKAEPMSIDAALKAAQAAFGKHIIGVTQQGVKGQATRVKIKCTDPQTVQGVNICVGTREIAIQDAFQVKRCTACQARVERKKRQQKRSAKAKERRAAAKANAAKANA